MTDDRLRSLERAATVDPAALGSLARARLRAGDARGHLAAIAALARTGDGEARRALEALVPCPGERGWGGTRAVRCAALQGAPRVVRGAVELDVAPTGFLLSGRTLLAVGAASRGKARNVVAIDASSLQQRWSVRAPSALPRTTGLVGDDVLVLAGRTLDLLAAEDGARLARLKLPLEPTWLLVEGDRVVAVGAGEAALVDVSRPALVWTRAFESAGEPRLGGGLLLARGRDAGVAALRLADGEPLALDAAGAQQVLALDASGVVYEVDGGWVERALATGVARWRCGDGSFPLAVGDELAVVFDPQPSRLRFVERRDGRTRFGLDGPPRVALASGVAYTLDPAGLVSAIDLTTGATRFQVALGPGLVEAGRVTPLFTAIDGGVLAAAARGTTVHVARVESA